VSKLPCDPASDSEVEALLREDRAEGEDEVLDASLYLIATEEVPAPPPQIPDYEMIRRLGGGGFGDVWLARSQTGVYRAVKLVPKGAVSAIEFEGIRTFESHARSHPNLIDIRHVGSTEWHFYYVMELADADAASPIFSPDAYEPRTLASELERHGPYRLREVLPLVRPILDALEYLHSRGLLHRDVKPSNIVFVGGVPKLADLGLLRHDSRDRFEGATPTYAPREGVIDASGDLYCFGKLLYEMVTGLDPAHFPEMPALASEEETKRFLRLLDRACAPSRLERFKSARELAAALERAAAPRNERARRIVRGAIRVLGVGAAVGAGFVAASWRTPTVAQQRPAQHVQPVREVTVPDDVRGPAPQQIALEPVRVRVPKKLPEAKPAKVTQAEEPRARGVAEELAKLGMDALVHARFSAAIELFKRATAADPTCASAWRGLGLALERSGRPDEAAVAYKKFLALAAPDAITEVVRERVRVLEGSGPA
jgi:tetratricopeptide (TPR) repeat protein